MTLEDLRGMSGLAYVATPYSQFKDGLEVAAIEAERHTEYLSYVYGIPAFSPIIHGHRLSRHKRLEPRDHDLWMRLNRPLMEASDVMIRVEMPGWEDSRGMREEELYFRAHGKPVVSMPALP